MQPSSAIRVEGAAYEWFKEQSEATGIPMAQLVSVLADYAKRRGLKFAAQRPVELVEPS